MYLARIILFIYYLACLALASDVDIKFINLEMLHFCGAMLSAGYWNSLNNKINFFFLFFIFLLPVYISNVFCEEAIIANDEKVMTLWFVVLQI